MKKTILSSACTLALLASSATFAAPTVTMTEHLLPTHDAAPYGIVAGAAAALPVNQVMWVTEMNSNKLAKLDQDGNVLNEYPIPVQGGRPIKITLGSNNRLWIIERGADGTPDHILHYGVSVGVDDYLVPDGQAVAIKPISDKDDTNHVAILVNKTEDKPAKIIKLKYDKGIVATSYNTNVTSAVSGFAIDANNDFLYGNWGADLNQINVMTIAGSPASPYKIDAKNGIRYITTAQDGTIWFTTSDSRIGKITTDHTISLYAAPNINEGGALVEGPDKAIWFTESDKDGKDSKIARLDPLDPAHIVEYKTTTSSTLGAITLGYDGKSLWFTETSANKVVKITLS